MLSALQRSPSTVSSHTSDRSAGRSHHPRLDGAIVGETGADQSFLVNSTTGMHTVSMSPDTLSSPEVGRASFTESFHISDQSATDHSYHRVEDASHRPDTYNTSSIGETGAGKSSWLHWFVRTQMAASSPYAISSSGRPSSPFHASYQSAAGRSFHRVEDTPHRTDTCNVVIVGETGAGKSSLVNSTADTQTPPLSPGTMSSSPDAGRASSTESVCDVWLFLSVSLI
ncbi:hypothetical protein EV702DRAFT_170115 [Suillus placidus]|uniref:Uncharacterized protein n=1 Tax=Suillus placidus TaxID=48579 RepID=A0A9P7D3K1_9AGAM|nr:hypothetical protein EV702DRAFT_170115 [Suillus placidus]